MDDTPGRRPTIADVARASGVSTATVSYVLNATPGRTISSATRGRVQEAAADLGYQANTYARALAGGTSTVAVVDLSEMAYDEQVGQLGREVAAVLEGAGFLPIVDHLDRSTGAGHQRLLSLARLLVPALVVSLTPLPAAVAAELRSLGVLRFIALMGRQQDPLSLASATALAQVDHLLRHGHRHVGYVGTGEPHLQEYDDARRGTVERRCAAEGVHFTVVGAGRDVDVLRHALAFSHRQPDRPTAIAAYNDEIALAVLAAAHHLGLRVPEELAVVGIDDSPLAAAAVPDLTSVRMTVGPVPTFAEVLALPPAAERVVSDQQLRAVLVRRGSS